MNIRNAASRSVWDEVAIGMTTRTKGRSGLTVFALLATLLVGAIGATVLMANGYRNLNRLLLSFDLPPIEAGGSRGEPPSQELRGNRMPRPRGLLPDRLFAPVAMAPAQFVRAIRPPPERLCAALTEAGFPNSGWRTGVFDKQSWECQSYRDFPADSDTAAPSSAFLSIRGNAETRISSFRIKLNIENPQTRDRVIDVTLAAIGVFLDEVHWEEAPDIFANLRALKEFDLIRFGNRIRLGKEFSETPRYNFIVTPDRKRNRGSYLPDYFDRSRWLPLREGP